MQRLTVQKNLREITEQLSDFRGLEIDRKRDLLRKHLDRVDVLQKHRLKALEFLKLESHARIDEELTKLDIRPSDRSS